MALLVKNLSCSLSGRKIISDISFSLKNGEILKISGENGSIVINQAIRDDLFKSNTEFIPISAAEDNELYLVLKNEKPVIHTLGE